ncbi:coiled-coil domain-containing protein 142 [Macrotis lagotis]|uniref:coiled-coil domain-containing protein 142 n=1 Tax=Macrotis lagotis TaxID=92651 RepID=UPI003D68CD9B
MARPARPGGFLPPLRTPAPGEPGEPAGALGEARGRASAVPGWRDGELEPGGPWAPRGRPRWPRAPKAQEGPPEDAEGAPEPWAAPRLPAALGRLRLALLRLQREREELLRARACVRGLQSALAFLRAPRPWAALAELRRELPPPGPRGAPAPPLALPLGLAARRLDAALEERLKGLGRAAAGPALAPRLAELLRLLPAYHQVLALAAGRGPGAARPFPPGRVLGLLAGERGRRGARQLRLGLREARLRARLHELCREEGELLPGLLGPLGASWQLGGQYWSLFWAACALSLGRRLGPWEDLGKVARELRQALDQASLPQVCEEALTALCHCLLQQASTQTWDRGFCQALGSTRGGRGVVPGSWDGTSCMYTTDLLRRLFPPLVSVLREPASASCRSPGPAPLALGLCTLQTTTLWLLSKCQQHLVSWDPGLLLLLIQRELPLLLCEAETLATLVSEGASVPELGKEIQRLTSRIQVLSEEALCLFSRECHRQAAKGFQLHMPQGRHWRLKLRSELPSIPSDYAELVVGAVLGPVLQGVQGLSPQAQGPPLTQALTALLDAWLNHILTQKIRFSLQGALQLKQDFAVVRGLLEEEQWGLTPELRQALLTLGVFQRADGALLCLLQQPRPGSRSSRGSWCCCSCNKIQTPELPSSSLNSLENLEPPPPRPVQTAQLLSTIRGGGPNPEAYLAGNQQAWLALRQHQSPRWYLPSFLCIRTSPEP